MSREKLKVIFMGTPDYADHILNSLINDQNIEVVAVYTQPDKPVGRKKIITQPPVKVTALKNNIDVYQPNRLREESVVDKLLKIESDFIVVAAYGQILPLEVLNHAPCINLHASILPQYRGASPIQQSLINGDSKSGVTAMLMDVGLDTGDILQIEEVIIDNEMMVEELFLKLTSVASDLTLSVLKNFSDLSVEKQDDSKATHCKKIVKADGMVQFEDAKKIYNMYRAFTPWPGIFLESGLKIKEMKLFDGDSEHKSFEVLEIGADYAKIGCKKGSLLITKVQPPSKKEMRITDYLNGKRITVGNLLS